MKSGEANGSAPRGYKTPIRQESLKFCIFEQILRDQWRVAHPGSVEFYHGLAAELADQGHKQRPRTSGGIEHEHGART